MIQMMTAWKVSCVGEMFIAQTKMHIQKQITVVTNPVSLIFHSMFLNKMSIVCCNYIPISECEDECDKKGGYCLDEDCKCKEGFDGLYCNRCVVGKYPFPECDSKYKLKC